MFIKPCSLLFTVVISISAVSFNRPQLCSNARWNQTGITVMGTPTLPIEARGFFIDVDDNLYAQHSGGSVIMIQFARNPTMISNITVGPIGTYSGLLASAEKDIYFESGSIGGLIYKRSLVTNNNTSVAGFSHGCYSLFIDVNDTLYCSSHGTNCVYVKPLANPIFPATIRAGICMAGNNAVRLNGPWGIFVNTNLDLYVADARNNRIQWFRQGEHNATTVAGSGIPRNLSLSFPIDVILDANDHLYIANTANHSIVRVISSISYDCVIGCSGGGSAAHQLNRVYSVRFDSYGNLLVVDEFNKRIQKFFLTYNCQIHSFHRPQLCSSVTWNETGLTIFQNTNMGSDIRGIFIDLNDTLYYAEYNQNRILVWTQGSIGNAFMTILSIPLFSYTTLFVSVDGGIYFSASSPMATVMRTSLDNSTTTIVAQFNSSCYGLFIDVNNTLYCSLWSQHRIDLLSLHNTSLPPVTRAGTSTNGSAPNQLYHPWGIFVDINFNLYVADSANNRIQRFRPNNNSAITLAGHGIPNGLVLNQPTDVIVDGHNQLYIADNKNHRILRVTASSYQCVVGCTCLSGSTSNQLSNAYALRFDSFGNLYVADEWNRRIQKFHLLPDCAQTSTVTLPTTCSQTSTSTTTAVAPSPSATFIPTFCSNTTQIGTFCNITNNPCTVLTPCLNNGSCSITNNSFLGYQCSCVSGLLTGIHCEIDLRLCVPPHCLNNGTCQVTPNQTQSCECREGWEGERCERRVNFCKNVTCENRGVCRSLLLDYRCECLDGSYSGRYCEKEALKIAILNIFARLVSIIAIIVMIGTALYIVTMDVLKYLFGIDLAIRPKTISTKRRRRKIHVVHYVYVDAPVSDCSH